MGGRNHVAKYCPAEVGRHMCELPGGHELHQSPEGHRWTTTIKVSYEEAVACAAREDALWTGSRIIGLIYGKDPNKVRADIRKA